MPFEILPSQYGHALITLLSIQAGYKEEKKWCEKNEWEF